MIGSTRATEAGRYRSWKLELEKVGGIVDAVGDIYQLEEGSLINTVVNRERARARPRARGERCLRHSSSCKG